MINIKCLDRQQIGFENFVDSHNNTRKVIHSEMKSQKEKKDMEDSIAEELYRIFAVHKK